MAESGRGHFHAEEEMLITGQDDSQYEMGMDAAPAMEDHHSSSLMPWSRQGSAVPGSSIRAPPPGSAQKGIPPQQQTAPSPLLHRSTNLITGFDRHSDPIEASTPLRAVADPVSFLDSSMDMDPVLDFTDTAYAGLDAASQEFLDYASKRAVAHGGRQQTAVAPSPSGQDASDGDSHRWIDFEHIANPLKHDSAIAAQAFLYVLSLATRGVVRVRQENNENGTVPFGTLFVGLNLSRGGDED